MPRPKKEGAPEPKKRSRTGCWPCKARKVKCGEEKPRCLNCERQGETCDYSIRLNWGGRIKNKNENDGFQFDSRSAGNSPSTIVFPTPEALTGHSTPSPSRSTFERSPKPTPTTIRHVRSHSNLTPSSSDSPLIDPDLLKPFGHNHSRSLHTFIGQDYLGARLPDIQPNLPLGLGTSIPSPLPRSNITSAPTEHQHRTFTFRPSTEYPSPSVSSLASPSFSGDTSLSSHDSPAAMLPPFRGMASSSPPTRSHTYSEEPPSIMDHRAKRMRLAPFGDASPMAIAASPLPIDLSFAPDSRSSSANVQSPNLAFLAPYNSPFQSSPLTPGSSIASSEEHLRNGAGTATPIAQYTPAHVQDPPDLRRLSVASLINDPEEDQKPVYKQHHKQYPITSNLERTTTYGYDLGRPDMDTPRNNDADAIMIFSPPVSRENTFNDDKAYTDSDFASDLGFGQRSRDMAFEPGGYYAKPVAIKIPQDLEPLPPQLLENGMNLLYFHHFLNHTARILVPHDCEQNPFRMVLPQMALKDPDLLNLLLAYSASHRARLLHHAEPANRIAMWVKDLFPKLRHALVGTDPIPIEALATAIMLASLEILSPNAFEVNIPWRDHLSMARQMTIARGGPRPLHRQDKVSYFLSRWFAYLDVMGSLSGRKIDKPLSSIYWADDDVDDEGDFQIDCLMGFTTRCVKILARVAELARECESDRLDANGNVREEWRPLPNVVAQAEQLKHDLREAREHVYKPCPYRSPADSESEVGWDSLEIIACNDMFHWAGLIQIDRRVLNVPLEHPEVQTAVKEIVGALYKIRPGSTAEANILFPLFTAGCHAMDQVSRERIISRLRSVEMFGMTHMHKAKNLMQLVWDTGKPWESLVSDEFVG